MHAAWRRHHTYASAVSAHARMIDHTLPGLAQESKTYFSIYDSLSGPKSKAWGTHLTCNNKGSCGSTCWICVRTPRGRTTCSTRNVSTRIVSLWQLAASYQAHSFLQTLPVLAGERDWRLWGRYFVVVMEETCPRCSDKMLSWFRRATTRNSPSSGLLLALASRSRSTTSFWLVWSCSVWNLLVEGLRRPWCRDQATSSICRVR